MLVYVRHCEGLCEIYFSDPRRRWIEKLSLPPHPGNIPLYPLHRKAYEPESQSECAEEKNRININVVVLPKDDSTGELASKNYCDCLFCWSAKCSTYSRFTWNMTQQWTVLFRLVENTYRFVEVNKCLSTVVCSGSMQHGTEREVFWVKELNVEVVPIFYYYFD